MVKFFKLHKEYKVKMSVRHGRASFVRGELTFEHDVYEGGSIAFELS